MHLLVWSKLGMNVRALGSTNIKADVSYDNFDSDTVDFFGNVRESPAVSTDRSIVPVANG